MKGLYTACDVIGDRDTIGLLVCAWQRLLVLCQILPDNARHQKMPDLPLPKPQPPTSSTQSLATSVSNQSVVGSAPTQVDTTIHKSPSSTLPQPATTNPPTTQTSPTGTVLSPQAVVPSKPPAVVTALSSVSSNQLPPIEVKPELKSSNQSLGVNASIFATSTPTITPPPTLDHSQANNLTDSVPARGTATNFGTVSSQNQVVSVNPPVNTNSSTIQPTIPSTPNSSPITPVPTQPITPISTQPSTPASTQSAMAPLPSVLPQSGTPAQSATKTQPPGPPPLAKSKKSPLKLIIGIVAAIIGLAVVVAIVLAVLNRPGRSSVDSGSVQPDQPSGQTGSNKQPISPEDQITLEYWGLWETSDALSSVFQDFQTQNPSITVRYVQQSHRDFRERLQNAIVSGSGPDLFRFHASWVPMLANELEPMPASVISTSDFSQTFYPVASRQLQLNGQLIGVPLMYEGLVLYYNQDVLETAGVQPPQTWSALRDAARTLSIKQPTGQLQRGGVAIGTAENVDHFADVLAVLMLQNGADLEQPNSPEGRDALLFYTNFVKQDQVWSADLPSSTLAFARGDVAMMFAPSWRAFEISQINPNLRFAAVTLPQLPNNKITWASYWAEGVSKQSKNKEAAWKLLQYLSTKEVQQKLFSAQSQVRAFGEPFSRVDLADQATSQPILGPLLQDAPTAQGWYMSTFTHDNGLNDQIIQYYKDAINSLLGSGEIDQVLVTLQEGVNQVLSTYGVTDPLEPTPTVVQY